MDDLDTRAVSVSGWDVSIRGLGGGQTATVIPVENVAETETGTRLAELCPVKQ